MADNDFSTLFDLLPIGAYRSSPHGQKIRANLALVKLDGYERASAASTCSPCCLWNWTTSSP